MRAVPKNITDRNSIFDNRTEMSGWLGAGFGLNGASRMEVATITNGAIPVMKNAARQP